VIQFTKNHRDHSNSQGFQFEFFCDKCGNGLMSEFSASAIGMADGVLKAAGAIFGGVLGRVAQGSNQMKDTLRSKGRDAAFGKAVEEAKKHFKKCTRCGKWVCPESCWNGNKNLCEECAPNLAEEAASAQAKAGAEQVKKKAAESDQTQGMDLSKPIMAGSNCGACGADLGGAKFCPECGQAVAPAKVKCGPCGAEMMSSVKFCPECGAKRAPAGVR
jgi:hypothetical protein